MIPIYLGSIIPYNKQPVFFIAQLDDQMVSAPT